MYTIAEAKEAVKYAVRGYLHKDREGNYVMEERNRLPLYLEGAPGIGKTEIVEQLAGELGLGFVSFSLVHHSRNSLLGLPVIEELADGEKYTIYTMSEIIAKVRECVEQGNKEGILLLDEFPCMSETVLPVMLAFLQTKNIGLHHLPEGWVIVLCGNPVQYNRSARKFDSAVLDRIRKIEIQFDAKCFVDYGRQKGLHETILSYLELHPEHAYRCSEQGGEKELVTCRGWENLSHAYHLYEELEQPIDRELIRQFIKSDEICDNFLQYHKQCQAGVTQVEMEEILLGKGFEKHYRKLKGLSYHQQWNLVNYLCELLTVKETAQERGMARYREISGWMNNVLEMLEAVDEKGILSEKAFQWINRDELLLKVVSNVKTQQYLTLCDRLLGDTTGQGQAG